MWLAIDLVLWIDFVWITVPFPMGLGWVSPFTWLVPMATSTSCPGKHRGLVTVALSTSTVGSPPHQSILLIAWGCKKKKKKKQRKERGKSPCPGDLVAKKTWVRYLVWKDPTCCGATKPVYHNYWACTLEPILCKQRSHVSETPTHCN